ncbi:ROK family protein [Pseudoflavitalea sp. G-6-1-2]|uniref:ROK family transcriptional regulator n=1 Tax=Pseudoflavitalea sp. G-6-1-2 TaxID=2728841 RepID=UPI00146DE2A9|nr:ROK family transcriptional regulator [Pseudoflavitalea sp. G-6-1-2]NML21604.1 ROK family protein [Pseudoflavitalea sp. G-6-1-2]
MLDIAERSPIYYEIIRQLYYGSVLSCTDLSARIDKSIPLVTAAVNQLIKAGYVEKRGLAPSSGGRRPLTYALKSDRLFVLTVAMDQLSTRIGIIDMFNKYVSGVEVVELKLRNNPKALERLVEAIAKHIEKSGIPKEKIIGAGIGMPGLVNANDGINYSYLDTNGRCLSEHLSESLGLKVFIDNDSSLIALAEQKFGKAHGFKNAMVINLGWGIGLGMVINGQLYRGDDGFAGEFSHIPLSEKGVLCYCGKQGCLESEASLLAVADKAIQGIRNGRVSRLAFLSDQDQLAVGHSLLDLANQGDQYAIDLFMDAAYKIGRGLAILIHINNPRAIVLSGRGAKIGRLILPPIQQALTRYCIPRLVNNIELLVSDFGQEAEMIGSAILVMEQFSPNIFASSAKSSRKISNKAADPTS